MEAVSKHGLQGEMIRAPIPPGRDPFVNTFLLALGKGEDGEERFWISSWNSNVGSLGVLVTESGKERIYRFESPHNGFYSAAQEDQDTIWLCGNLSTVVRLTLSTGSMEAYETGAPPCLVFQGMVLDHKTGRLAAAAYQLTKTKTAAFSFDYRNRKPVKVYDDVCKELHMCSSFPNGNGTYSCVMYNPGVTLLHWNPQNESMESVSLSQPSTDQLNPLKSNDGISRLISNDEGWWYFPEKGWYNPVTRSLMVGGMRPDREMTWFARRGSLVWGVSSAKSGVNIGVWDMSNGQVSELCSIPDAQTGCVNLTAAEKVVVVNMYGEFYRFDGKSGELELYKPLPTNSIGRVESLCRINEERLLGTSYITQRFWEINLGTGEGHDCGRAAPGAGEILKTWNLDGKIYMAAYVGNELVEYNPEEHPRFPENPRVVANPPGGMRPVAAAANESVLYYSASHHYGNLGCILTRYDSASGAKRYEDDPIPGQMIRSLLHDKDSRSLLAGTTMFADCNSCKPSSDLCYFARVDDSDLSVIEQCAAPKGTRLAAVKGPVSKDEYLCTVSGDFNGENTSYWFILSSGKLEVPALQSMQKLPKNMRELISAGKFGLFILHIDDRIELWDMLKQRCIQILYTDPEIYSCQVQGDSVYLVTPKEVLVLENCLAVYS